jgi:hypothetical protein
MVLSLEGVEYEMKEAANWAASNNLGQLDDL